MIFRIFIACVLLGLFACAKSENYSTGVLEGHYLVTLRDDGTVLCEAQVYENTQPWSNPVQLSSGDTLWCDGVQMSAPNGPYDYKYQSLPTYHPGQPYVVTLKRGGSEFNASVTLPAAIAISSPAPGAVVPNNSSFTLTWTPFFPGSRIYISSTHFLCGWINDDQGTLNCPVNLTTAPLTETLQLSRSTQGTVASGFRADITGTVKSSVQIQITP